MESRLERAVSVGRAVNTGGQKGEAETKGPLGKGSGYICNKEFWRLQTTVTGWGCQEAVDFVKIRPAGDTDHLGQVRMLAKGSPHCGKGKCEELQNHQIQQGRTQMQNRKTSESLL